MDGSKSKLFKTSLVTAAGLGLLLMVVAKRKHLFQYLHTVSNPLKRRRIKVVQTVDECQSIVSQLQKDCKNLKVLGFDCEWVTVGGTRRPAALLQLSSGDGLCALFRLCCMKQIPKSLRDLLENENIIKVGVAPQGDAQKLSYDYGVGVASTLDLRFLAVLTGKNAEGLAKMSKSVLNIELDKHWRLVCSDWETKDLTEKQIEYAANDAFVAIEIFKRLSKVLAPNYFWQSTDFASVLHKLEPFYELNYKEGFKIDLHVRMKAKNIAYSNRKNNDTFIKKTQLRGISTRTKNLYDNCLLQAPDGELLCTIERRKAKWYIEQGLGIEVLPEPLTVRLNFEPAGRAVGEVGKYYQIPKENQCVVCGFRETFIRKNVIPREYRKHFPAEVMKSHTSHDVLLLCPNCHQLSNISDLKIRQKLNKMCNAPLTTKGDAEKMKDIPELRQVKSAARALISSKDTIPSDRKQKLESIILNYYKETEISFEMLQNASEIDTKVNIDNNSVHGKQVVEKFQADYGGLLQLERIWREHFINTMQPKYLPMLWNINHNANRLNIRNMEGRVKAEDLKIAGSIEI